MELIKIENKEINSREVQTVNARELYKFLEINDHFANWIKGRVEAYGFEENIDFCIYSEKTEKRGRPTKEYFLTLSMAKELAMVERNEKGKEARKYFIECERKLLQSRPALSTKQQCFLEIAEAPNQEAILLGLNKLNNEVIVPLEQSVERMAPKEEFYDSVVQSESHVDIGQAAKLLNYDKLGRNNLYKYLREEGILNHKNIPYQQYLNQGYFKLVESSWVNPTSQELEVSVKPVMFQKGLDWLEKKLRDEGFKKRKY